MRDFNFFAPYEQEPKKKTSGSNVLMIVAAGLLALCLALVIFNTMFYIRTGVGGKDCPDGLRP